MLRASAARTVLVTILVATAALGCGHAAVSPGAARDVRLTSAQGGVDRRVPQAELLEDVQRFTGEFLEAVTQAVNEDADERTDAISNDALRAGLLAMASALDIASEPLPELAVLDMVVFLRLGRATLADHWVPKVYGERWRPILAAFATAEERFWPIASKILSESQKAYLVARIDAWHRENPNLVRVAAVRLTDFSVHAGAVAVAREQEISGLFSAVKAATKTGDQAVMLGERGVFLVNRLPFLLRLQVRLGTREILGDTMAAVGSTGMLKEGIGKIDPLLEQLPPLVSAGKEAVHESRLLAADVAPLVPTREELERIQHTIDSLNGLVVNTSAMVSDVRATTTGPDSAVERTTAHVDALMQRGLLYLTVLGVAWASIWWGGYVLAKRAVRGRRKEAHVEGRTEEEGTGPRSR